LAGSITAKDIENEVKAIEKLRSHSQHKNIIKVFRHDWMVSNSSFPVYHFDMELGDLTLAQFIQDKFYCDPFPGIALWEVWPIMLDLEGGLTFLHRRQLIHRDLKPANSEGLLLIVLIYSSSCARPSS
jgi:serine/threonine protein kinase